MTMLQPEMARSGDGQLQSATTSAIAGTVARRTADANAQPDLTAVSIARFRQQGRRMVPRHFLPVIAAILPP